MLNLLICELLKLKRAKMLLFTVLGTQAVPAMMFIEMLQQHFEHPDRVISLDLVYANSLLYVMLLMNMMIYVAITAYLFSREYTEHTLKNLLPLPLSRARFISGKFLTVLVLILALTFISWLGILIVSGIFNLLFGMEGFALTTALLWLVKMLAGGLLMFWILTPFAYAALKSKGLVIPMIAAAVIVMGSCALCNQDWGALYPWTATYLLIKGTLTATGFPLVLTLLLLGLVSLLGFVFTYRFFQREDLR